MTAIRGVLYARKSNEDRTNEQRETESVGESVQQQTEWAEAAAEREGVTLVERFADQAIPGWEGTDKRTGLADLIAFCKRQAELGRPISCVVVWAENRLSRSDVIETFAHLNELRRAGVSKLLTAAGWRDLFRSEDLILYAVRQQASDAQYSIDLSRSTKRGKRARAARGLWNGGTPPYGYEAGPEGKLIVNATQAAVVKLLFDEYLNRQTSIRGLIRLLAERGIASPTGRPRWIVQTVVSLLQNPTVCGELVCGRRDSSPFQFAGTFRVQASTRRKVRKPDPSEWVRVPGAHEAIITAEQFAACQAKLIANRSNTSPAKGEPFILTGLVRCGGCGGPMVGRTLRGADSRYGRWYANRYYCCNAYNAGGKGHCHFNAVKEKLLVAAVVKKLTRVFTDPATVAAIREELLRVERADAENPEDARLTARLADLDTKLKVAADRFLSCPEEAIEQVRIGLKELKGQRDRVAAELNALRARSVAQEPLEARIEAYLANVSRLKEVFDKADPAAVRQLLREVIDRIELHFSHSAEIGKKKRVYTKFARGLIYLKSEVFSTVSSSTGWRCSPTDTSPTTRK